MERAACAPPCRPRPRATHAWQFHRADARRADAWQHGSAFAPPVPTGRPFHSDPPARTHSCAELRASAILPDARFPPAAFRGTRSPSFCTAGGVCVEPMLLGWKRQRDSVLRAGRCPLAPLSAALRTGMRCFLPLRARVRGDVVCTWFAIVTAVVCDRHTRPVW
eukprot:3148064-Prymnesium_polylepis.1